MDSSNVFDITRHVKFKHNEDRLSVIRCLYCTHVWEDYTSGVGHHTCPNCKNDWGVQSDLSVPTGLTHVCRECSSPFFTIQQEQLICVGCGENIPIR